MATERGCPVVVALAIAATGCSSSSFGTVEVVAPTAEVPISMTSGLVDREGLVSRARIRSLGAFTFVAEECVKNGLVRLDISQAVNEQVAALDGDAITELEIQSREGRCAAVRGHGSIVKVVER